MKLHEKDKWVEAMQEEMNNMRQHKVWHLVSPPTNKTPLGSRWVYTLKRDEHGTIARFKARLVAQGYTQVKGETYDETFSPVVNFSIIRFFFALLVVCCKWLNLQCDIKSAYLYAPIDEEILMYQPPGFVEKGKENLVCRLNRALYGLHQSGRLWYFEFNSVLLELGFKKFQWCNCAYYFQNNTVLLVYVDDIVIFGKNKNCIDKAIERLKVKFDLKILGTTIKLLGVEFLYSNDCIRIHQGLYIDEVLNRFKSYHFPISSLPIVKGVKYSKSDCPSTETEQHEMARFPYRNVLGCLSFIAGRTRPDLAYAINIFSQFQNNPGITHWNGLLKLLGYLAYTNHYKLKLQCKVPHIDAYSDADFASSRDDMVSLGGQIIFLDKAPIHWKTFKQRAVSLSTMEAEFVAMVETTREIIWLYNVLSECFEYKIITGNKEKPVLYADNMAAINFSKSPIENTRSKHINVKLFFIRELLQNKVFSVRYIRSCLNLADQFTKPLTKYNLLKYVNVIFDCNEL